MKKAIALFLTCVLALSLAACDGGGSNSAQTDTLTVKLGPITDYDPFNAFGADQYVMMNAIYATLLRVEYNDSGEPELVGDLAESWECEADDTVYVFHLKEDAAFANGEPITASDVKFSFEMAAASPYQVSYAGMIQSIEVRDEHTVALNIGAYNNILPWAWSHIYIASQAAYEADPAAYATDPVESGAYTLENLDTATGNMTLKARSDYWGPAPAIENVNIRIISDSDTAYVALESGQIDVMGTSGSGATLLEKNDKLVLQEHPNNGMGGLFLNCQVEPWTNVKLRQAVAYAVDYEAMRQLLYDGRVSSDSTVPYGTLTDPLPEGLNEYEYDVEKAKALVAESGATAPVNGGGIIGGSGGVSELLQQYLKEVGIEVEVLDISGGDFVNALISGDYSLAFIPGASSSINGSQLLTNSFATGGSFNYALYSNPEVDALAAELSVERDGSVYQQKLAEAMSIVADEAPIINFGNIAYYTAQQKDLFVPTTLCAEIYIPGCAWK